MNIQYQDGNHLSIRNSDMYPGMTDENIYEHMSKQIQIFKKNLTVPLLLENTLDTPQDRGWNIHDYIRQLPLNRVIEIHVNGCGYDKDGFPADTYQAMENEDYKLLEWVLNYANSDIVKLK